MSAAFLCGGCGSLELTQLPVDVAAVAISCGHSNEPHFSLAGCAPTGLAWTTMASLFPRTLSRVLAKLLLARARCTLSA